MAFGRSLQWHKTRWTNVLLQKYPLVMFIAMTKLKSDVENILLPRNGLFSIYHREGFPGNGYTSLSILSTLSTTWYYAHFSKYSRCYKTRINKSTRAFKWLGTLKYITSDPDCTRLTRSWRGDPDQLITHTYMWSIITPSYNTCSEM